MMRKFLKRSLMFVMVLALLLPALPVAMPVSAATVTGAFAPSPDGSIRGAPWRLYSNGALVVDWGFIQWNSTDSLWHAHRANISSITFTGPITAGRLVRGLFSNLSNVTTIDGLEHFDTSNVTNMSRMFNNASSLTSLDLSSWDTSSVVYINHMFYRASGLTSLDVSGWDVSSVGSTPINPVFRGVSDMAHMFRGASGLTSLDLSSWDVSRVRVMVSMFDGASGLTSLDLSGWDTSSVTHMGGMFAGASGLTSLDLSHFDTSNVTDTQGMFRGASGLTSLDLSGWDTSNVIRMNGMFREATGLTSLDLSYFTANPRHTTNMERMFRGASSLVSIDLSGWTTSASGLSMLSGASSLRYLTLGAGFYFRPTRHPAIPDVPTNATYSGRWTDGTRAFTANHLRQINPSFITLGGTWTWQRVGEAPLDPCRWCGTDNCSGLLAECLGRTPQRIPGMVKTHIYADGTCFYAYDFRLNLTNERIETRVYAWDNATDDYVASFARFGVRSFTIDGRRWRNVPDNRDFHTQVLPGLLNRAVPNLIVSDRPLETSRNSRNRGRPLLDGLWIEFPPIAARPRVPGVVVNYDFGSYTAMSAEAPHGMWTLTTRATRHIPAVRLDYSQFVMAPAAQILHGRVLNIRANAVQNWASMTSLTAARAVQPPGIGNIVVRTRYFARGASSAVTTGGATVFTPMSRARRITVSSALRAPNIRPHATRHTLSVRRGMMLYSPSTLVYGNVTGLPPGTTDLSNNPVFTDRGVITNPNATPLEGLRFRVAPTARRPASMPTGEITIPRNPGG